MTSELQPVLHDLARRLRTDAHLEDFLSWTAGTLEYWVHVMAYGAARAHGQASPTEVPYITGCPSPSSRSNEKWADGAFLLDTNVGVLLEVKTVVARGKLGPTISKVPSDMAALLSADWPATLLQTPDQYAGPTWVEMRRAMRRAYGLQLLLVHGATPRVNPDGDVKDGLARGLAALRRRFPDPALLWPSRVAAALARPLHRTELGAGRTWGVLYAWVSEIPVP